MIRKNEGDKRQYKKREVKKSKRKKDACNWQKDQDRYNIQNIQKLQWHLNIETKLKLSFIWSLH